MFEILSYKLSRENTQLENRLDILFEKTKSHGEMVNRTSAYAEAAVQRVLFGMRNFAEFTRKRLCRNLFFLQS